MSLKQTVFAIALGVLSFTLIFLAIDLVLAQPEYDQFCDFRAGPKFIADQKDCNLKINEEQENQCYKDKGFPAYTYDNDNCPIYESCDFCQLEYNEAMEKYNNKIFYIAIPIGLAFILFGLYYTLSFIGTGFMIGGIILVIYGTIRNFSTLSKLGRFITILIELAILIWIGIKKLSPDKPKNAHKKSKK